LPAQGFELHSQRVVDLTTDDISEFKASIRRQYPNLGLVARPAFSYYWLRS